MAQRYDSIAFLTSGVFNLLPKLQKIVYSIYLKFATLRKSTCGGPPPDDVYLNIHTSIKKLRHWLLQSEPLNRACKQIETKFPCRIEVQMLQRFVYLDMFVHDRIHGTFKYDTFVVKTLHRTWKCMCVSQTDSQACVQAVFQIMLAMRELDFALSEISIFCSLWNLKPTHEDADEDI